MERNAILNLLRRKVSAARFEHCLGVETIALALAPHFGAPEAKVSPAALLHDLCREYPPELLLKLAANFDIVIDNIEQAEPVLLHGPVGAALVREELGLDDPEILEAIQFHITGAPGLAPVGRLVFVADLIEPGRVFPVAQHLRQAAFEISPDQLLLRVYDHTLEHLIRQGYLLHPRMVAGRNELIRKGV